MVIPFDAMPNHVGQPIAISRSRIWRDEEVLMLRGVVGHRLVCQRFNDATPAEPVGSEYEVHVADIVGLQVLNRVRLPRTARRVLIPTPAAIERREGESTSQPDSLSGRGEVTVYAPRQLPREGFQ